jgi:hypothetical protein
VAESQVGAMELLGAELKIGITGGALAANEGAP